MWKLCLKKVFGSKLNEFFYRVFISHQWVGIDTRCVFLAIKILILHFVAILACHQHFHCIRHAHRFKRQSERIRNAIWIHAKICQPRALLWLIKTSFKRSSCFAASSLCDFSLVSLKILQIKMVRTKLVQRFHEMPIKIETPRFMGWLQFVTLVWRWQLFKRLFLVVSSNLIHFFLLAGRCVADSYWVGKAFGS